MIETFIPLASIGSAVIAASLATLRLWLARRASQKLGSSDREARAAIRKLVVFREVDNLYHFSLIDADGNVLIKSSAGFETADDAIREFNDLAALRASLPSDESTVKASK